MCQSLLKRSWCDLKWIQEKRAVGKLEKEIWIWSIAKQITHKESINFIRFTYSPSSTQHNNNLVVYEGKKKSFVNDVKEFLLFFTKSWINFLIQNSGYLLHHFNNFPFLRKNSNDCKSMKGRWRKNNFWWRERMEINVRQDLKSRMGNWRKFRANQWTILRKLCTTHESLLFMLNSSQRLNLRSYEEERICEALKLRWIK